MPIIISLGIPLVVSSCSLPNLKLISCKNTSIDSVYQDGTVASTPNNVLGNEEFTWYPDDKKIEVKQFNGFSQDGKMKEELQVVKANLKGDILTFGTKPHSIFPGKSFVVNTKTGFYSSQDSTYQSSIDGSFKVLAKGTCVVPK